MLTRTSTLLLQGLCDSGNERAWEEFDRRYRPLVLQVARHMGLNEVDAEDAAQETMSGFIQAYRDRQYQREKGRLRDWLCGIANHKIKDLQRRKGQQKKRMIQNASKQPLWERVEDRCFEQAWQDEWRKALLRQCLTELEAQVSEQSFEIFFACTIKQWSAQEVSDAFHVSKDVVYQTKHRMLERIQKLLLSIEAIW